MSKQVIKIPSVQGGPFHQNNRQYEVINIELPSDGVYDATESYINVYMSAEDANGDNGPIRFIQGSTSYNENPYLFNTSFIRNYSIDSETKGHIDGCRFSNVLNQNLLSYTTSKAEKKDLEYTSLYNPTTPEILKDFKFVKASGQDPTTAGNLTKVYNNVFRTYDLTTNDYAVSNIVEVPIMVPLSHLSPLGLFEELPLDKLGPINLQIETDLNAMPQFQVAATPIINCDDQGNVATTVTVSTVKVLSAEADERFLYAGQTFDVDYDADGTADTTENLKIIDVSKDVATGDKTITFNAPYYTNGTAANVAVDNIKITHKVSNPFPPKVNKVELVLTKVGDKSNVNKLEYTSWGVEMASGNGVETFQRNYMVEPDVFNAVFLMPNNNETSPVAGGGAAVAAEPKYGAQTISNAKQPSYYRLSLNNEDLTNRDVSGLSNNNVKGKYEASLYYDRIMTTLKNGGYQLKDLRENNEELMLCNPLPLTNDTKMLQLTYNAAAVNDIYLYKQKLKSINL